MQTSEVVLDDGKIDLFKWLFVIVNLVFDWFKELDLLDSLHDGSSPFDQGLVGLRLDRVF